MFSPFLFLIGSSFSISIVSSSALPSPLNVISSSLNQPTVFETSNTNNKSLQDLTVPVSTYSPDCSVLYGGNLDLASCDNALEKISQVTTPMSFGERGMGTWNVVLPRRYLSGRL